MSRSFSFALHMPHWPKNFGQEPPGKPSERVKSLLYKLGNPETKLPPVIHVGGTKGKGSTIAFLRAMLEAAGYKVHAYTSPHLDRFNERIVLAGREIDDAMLYEIIEETRIACGDMPIGMFDATTAAAMLAFARAPADIMLMEMGLGGAFDATSFIDRPLLTILTTLSFDHMEYMGDTLQSIAAFEAGLFKPQVPCVVSYQHPDCWPTLEQKAAEAKSPLYSYGKNWLIRKTAEGMLFADSHGEAKLPLPSLLGAHQMVNAGNAIAAISLLHDFDIAPEHIIQGLMQTHWKGRLEQISAPSLPKGGELWFDGGHNMAAAQAISIFVQEQWSDKPFYLIFGASLDKDVAAMLTPFAGVTAGIYSIMGKSEPKNYTAEQVAELARPVASVIPCDSIKDALRDITQHANGPFRALVFGSLYFWLEANDKYTRNQ